MGEALPEVFNCCVILSLRIGMLFISVLGFMSGALMLNAVQELKGVDYNSMSNVTKILITGKVSRLSMMNEIIINGVAAVCILFIIFGITLLFATLSDSEGFIQMFVWLACAAIIGACVLIVASVYECTFMDKCVFESMDWLSASIILVSAAIYLLVWLYFVIVANSYVLQMSGMP